MLLRIMVEALAISISAIDIACGSKNGAERFVAAAAAVLLINSVISDMGVKSDKEDVNTAISMLCDKKGLFVSLRNRQFAHLDKRGISVDGQNCFVYETFTSESWTILRNFAVCLGEELRQELLVKLKVEEENVHETDTINTE